MPHVCRALGDVELLSMLLRGSDRLSVAAELLARFGSLQAIRKCEIEELRTVPGIGHRQAAGLLAALELGRRSEQPPSLGRCIEGPHDAWALLQPRMRGLDHEELHGLYVNRRHRVLAHRVLTRGDQGSTVVDPRQIFRLALVLRAGGVVLAHNHPSGDPRPSERDREVTHKVARAGELLGVTLLDHLVVGRDDYVSLASSADGLGR